MNTHTTSSFSIGARALIAAGLWALLAASVARAANDAPPERLSYKGYLTDNNGAPIPQTGTANRAVVFRIYDDLTGGNLIWSEQQTVTLDQGVFSVLLGEGSQYQSERNEPLSTVFFGPTASDRYIEIDVEKVGKLAPRMQLLSSPYSLLATTALTANSLSNGPIVTRGDGTLTVDSAGSGTVYTSSAGIHSFDGVLKLGPSTLSSTGLSVPNLSVDQNVNVTGDLVTQGSVKGITGVVAETSKFLSANPSGLPGSGFDGDSREAFQIDRPNVGKWHMFMKDDGGLYFGDANPNEQAKNGELSDWEFSLESSGRFTTTHDVVSKGDVVAQGGALKSVDSTVVTGAGFLSDKRDFLRVDRNGGTMWHMYTSAAGHLYFGDDNPHDVPGADYEYLFENNGTLTVAGDLRAFGGVSASGDVNARNFHQNSDIRLKKDVEDLQPGVLGKIVSLRPIRYRFRSQGADEPKQFGFSAQELREVFPEVVTSRPSDDPELGETLSVGYGQTAALAIGAIKELNEKSDSRDASHQARMDALEDENRDLKSQLEDLQSQLNALALRFQ